MSGAQCFAVDSFAPQLNNLTRKMTRVNREDAGEWALMAREARLLIREILLTGPSRVIDPESAWVACHRAGSFTVLGGDAVIIASLDGSMLRSLRWNINGRISWHIDFSSHSGEIEKLLDALFSVPLRPAYVTTPLSMRVRITQDSKVRADFQFDEFSEASQDMMNIKNQIMCHGASMAHES
jgi:hypothetical protein